MVDSSDVSEAGTDGALDKEKTLGNPGGEVASVPENEARDEGSRHGGAVSVTSRPAASSEHGDDDRKSISTRSADTNSYFSAAPDYVRHRDSNFRGLRVSLKGRSRYSRYNDYE
jgi:hypothetical protein